MKELPEKSTDIESYNVLKRYQRRPRKLELLCLAHFVVSFNCVDDNTRSNVQEKSDNNFLPKTAFRDNVDDDPFDETDETDDTTGIPIKRRNDACQKKKQR